VRPFAHRQVSRLFATGEEDAALVFCFAHRLQKLPIAFVSRQVATAAIALPHHRFGVVQNEQTAVLPQIVQQAADAPVERVGQVCLPPMRENLNQICQQLVNRGRVAERSPC
jgi:hypothetical protein